MTSYKITGGLPKYFKRFCVKDGTQWGGALSSPFWQGDKAYATDGRVMIWARHFPVVVTGDAVSAPDMQRCIGQYMRIDGMQTNTPYQRDELRDWPSDAISITPGLRGCETSAEPREKIGPCLIATKYSKRIQRLGKVRFAATGGTGDPLYFQTSRVCGVIMPLSPGK